MIVPDLRNGENVCPVCGGVTIIDKFVWWWRCWRLGWQSRWDCGLDSIYSWVLRLGPLEIRRWRDKWIRKGDFS